jgi:hypothetical protein
LRSSAGSAAAPASASDCLQPRASEEAHVVDGTGRRDAGLIDGIACLRRRPRVRREEGRRHAFARRSTAGPPGTVSELRARPLAAIPPTHKGMRVVGETGPQRMRGEEDEDEVEEEKKKKGRLAGRAACFGRFSSRRPLLRAPDKDQQLQLFGSFRFDEADKQVTDWQPPWLQSLLPRSSVAPQQQRRRSVANRPEPARPERGRACGSIGHTATSNEHR